MANEDYYSERGGGFGIGIGGGFMTLRLEVS